MKARKLTALSDEDMVALQRANLINPIAPNPSVETLLHAFLPHKFVDHTHSTAILSIVDQDNSRELCDKIFGKRLGFVPYIMPGFDLAVAAAAIYEQDTSVEGLILDKHGIFTFAETAKDAYERMIEFVTLAEDFVAKNGKSPLGARDACRRSLRRPPRSRRCCGARSPFRATSGKFDRMISDFRTSDKIRAFVDAAQCRRLCRQRGVSTPDLVDPHQDRADGAAGAGRCAVWTATATSSASAWRPLPKATPPISTQNDARDSVKRTMLDPMPRLTLVPGLGMFGHGRTLKDAKIAADVGEMWIEAVTGAEAIGSFRPLSHDELFRLEYWSLEQAKLAAAKPKALTGNVVVVTGGAGAIGAATAKLFAEQGRACRDPRSRCATARRMPRRRPATIRSASPAT